MDEINDEIDGDIDGEKDGEIDSDEMEILNGIEISARE